MTNVIIIHGLNGNPNENWFQWLKAELEKRGFNVYIPQMPIDDKQTLEGWDQKFNEYYKLLDNNSILVAHSLGVPFALKVLEQKKRQINAAFLVAGFTEILNNPKFDAVVSKFVDKGFDFHEIKKKATKFYVYGSDNDPYVPYEKTKNLSDKLDVEPILIEGAGHFNTESGYDEFEDILIDIISIENSTFTE